MSTEVTAIVTCMTDAEQPFLREALQSVQNQDCTVQDDRRRS